MLQKGKLNSGKELDYAFGLVHGKYRGLETIDHGGADAGYRADLLRFPNQHFSVACLCNLAQTNPGELTQKVADIYLAGELKDDPDRTAGAEGKEVALPEAKLASFAGLYWDKENEGAMRLVLKEGKLSVGFSAEESYPLKPIAENRLRMVGPPVNLEFKAGADGGPLTIALQRDGVDHADTFEARPEFNPSKEQLAAIAGAYRSEEIEPVYRLVVEKSSLVLKRLKSKPAILEPTITDQFSSPFGSLHFIRDAQGQVTGFILNAGRIKGVKFKKSS